MADYKYKIIVTECVNWWMLDPVRPHVQKVETEALHGQGIGPAHDIK